MFGKVEDTLVFGTKGEAEAKLEEVAPIITEASAVAKELNAKMKLAREAVIGKPPYTEIEV